MWMRQSTGIASVPRGTRSRWSLEAHPRGIVVPAGIGAIQDVPPKSSSPERSPFGGMENQESSPPLLRELERVPEGHAEPDRDRLTDELVLDVEDDVPFPRCGRDALVDRLQSTVRTGDLGIDRTRGPDPMKERLAVSVKTLDGESLIETALDSLLRRTMSSSEVSFHSRRSSVVRRSSNFTPPVSSGVDRGLPDIATLIAMANPTAMAHPTMAARAIQRPRRTDTDGIPAWLCAGAAS